MRKQVQSQSLCRSKCSWTSYRTRRREICFFRSYHTTRCLQAVEECNDLAPLHNPANLIGIRACQELMPGVPMVAVFDTAFHQTMPEKAYLYGLPYEYYEKYKVRRYGFHGTSHSFVSKDAAEFLGKDLERFQDHRMLTLETVLPSVLY